MNVLQTSGAAMSRFVVVLLSVSVIQGQGDWGVTYTSTEICALKGSSVEISCWYRYPSRINGSDTTVGETFWFINSRGEEPVDLRTYSDYAGRVEHRCENNICTLRITDLRASDSATYKFRFITNQPGGKYTGSAGVTLSVTGLHVQVSSSRRCKTENCIWSQLKCHSSCRLRPDQSSYIWYYNGQKIEKETSSSHFDYVYLKNSISCALNGHEDFPSHSVCGYGEYCNRVTYAYRRICAFKGSSVDISCSYNSYEYVTSKFWFSPERSHQWWYPSQPEDLSKDSQYAGRVQILETERGRSTLRIADLRESDTAQYRFKFKSLWFEWRSSLPGTTLTVTDPDLWVQVIWSATGPKLICHSSCLTDRYTFVWYKNEMEIQQETFPSYRGYVDPAYSYSCAYKSYRSPAVYAPTVPLVLMNPPGDIIRDSSVTLTCSSDANPAAKYTWYKKNQTLLSDEPQLVFSSIQPSDSGEYYCTAENVLGRRTSTHVFVNVKYGPNNSTLSVSPSGEIMEGSSVNLTCSSDANPAANYTWYKENQTLLKGPENIYHLTSISSEDSGIYYCKSENKYGQINSSSYFIDVQGAMNSMAIGTITAVLLVIVLLAVFLWMRTNKFFTQQSKGGKRPAKRAQLNMDPVYDSIPAAAQRQPGEQQDDLHYATIHFSLSQRGGLDSNIRSARTCRQIEEEDGDDGVEYSTIKTDNASSTPGTRHYEDGEDSFEL